MEVSVVLCTYNGEAFISEQLNSIIGQTYPVKEILIFDDNSSDNTFQLLQDFASRYDHVKIHRNPSNIGFTRNFEQALRGATAEIIAISDQDDVWEKTKIEKMLKAWNDRSPLIYCRSARFTGSTPANLGSNTDLVFFEGTDGRKLCYFNTVSGHAMLVKKEFLPKVLPFKEGIMYDWWMALVAAYNGGVQHHPEILVYQRVHEGNITVTAKKISKRDKISAHNRQAARHNGVFTQATGIPADHQQFFEQFATLLQSGKAGKLNKGLLAFLVKNRKIIFYYKKSFNFFSYLKHSYRIARYQRSSR